MSGGVLITGGSGFLGTNLVQTLLDAGEQVVSLDVEPPKNPEHRGLWREVDILDRETFLSEVRDAAPRIVIHFAARTDLHGQTVADYAANVAGVQNAIDAVNGAGTVERAIYASTRLVFEISHRPSHDYDYRATTPYGASKIEGEKLVLAQDDGAVPWVMVRPTSIWGPWFDVPYRNFFDAIARGRYVHPKGRRIHKSFGYVGNVVHEVVELTRADLGDIAGRVFFVADYEPLEVRSWADLIRDALGAPRVREVPLPVMRALAKAGDGLRRAGVDEPPLTSFRLDNLLTSMTYDMAPLERVVGPLPYDLRSGVRETARWLETAGAR